MSKQKKTAKEIEEIKPIELKKNNKIDFTSFTFQSLFLLAITILFYGNTLWNEFCLDDGLVWTDNKFVKEGFKGIFDIFFHDSFYGTIGNGYNLGGGRWRPLSLITFAIENGIFQSPKAFPAHLINLLLYGLTAIVLLRFLRKFVFPAQPWMAFISVFLFVIHPVHTEVVANIKSRDEILSLLFLLLMLHNVLDYARNNDIGKLILALLCYFLALLSKENGLMFLFILPLSLWVFTDIKPDKIAVWSLMFVAIAAGYLSLRYLIIGFKNETVTEIMDNPYYLANTSQKLGTIFYVFLIYFRLLFYPHPLTYDYNYNQIPYRDFSDPMVLFSIALHVLLIGYAIYYIRKKDIIAYCILFYLASIFIVSNIFINIGAPLGERFLYQPSIVFSIALVIIGNKIFTQVLKLKGSSLQYTVGVLLLLITIPAAAKTITRNAVWRYGYRLGITDVETSTNSAKANYYASLNYIALADSTKDKDKQNEYWKKVIYYAHRSNEIYPDFFNNYLNWGVAYSRLDSLQQAEHVWNEAWKLNPNAPALIGYYKYLSQKYFPMAMHAANDKNYNLTIAYFKKSIRYDSTYAEAWDNLGGVYFTVGKYDSAKIAWQKTLQIKPDYGEAIQGLSALRAKGF